MFNLYMQANKNDKMFFEANHLVKMTTVKPTTATTQMVYKNEAKLEI